MNPLWYVLSSSVGESACKPTKKTPLRLTSVLLVWSLVGGAEHAPSECLLWSSHNGQRRHVCNNASGWASGKAKSRPSCLCCADATRYERPWHRAPAAAVTVTVPLWALKPTWCRRAATGGAPHADTAWPGGG